MKQQQISEFHVGPGQCPPPLEMIIGTCAELIQNDTTWTVYRLKDGEEQILVYMKSAMASVWADMAGVTMLVINRSGKSCVSGPDANGWCYPIVQHTDDLLFNESAVKVYEKETGQPVPEAFAVEPLKDLIARQKSRKLHLKKGARYERAYDPKGRKRWSKRVEHPPLPKLVRDLAHQGCNYDKLNPDQKAEWAYGFMSSTIHQVFELMVRMDAVLLLIQEDELWKSGYTHFKQYLQNLIATYGAYDSIQHAESRMAAIRRWIEELGYDFNIFYRFGPEQLSELVERKVVTNADTGRQWLRLLDSLSPRNLHREIRKYKLLQEPARTEQEEASYYDSLEKSWAEEKVLSERARARLNVADVLRIEVIEDQFAEGQPPVITTISDKFGKELSRFRTQDVKITRKDAREVSGFRREQFLEKGVYELREIFETGPEPDPYKPAPPPRQIPDNTGDEAPDQACNDLDTEE